MRYLVLVAALALPVYGQQPQQQPAPEKLSASEAQAVRDLDKKADRIRAQMVALDKQLREVAFERQAAEVDIRRKHKLGVDDTIDASAGTVRRAPAVK
jgi:hypothetical protein